MKRVALRIGLLLIGFVLLWLALWRIAVSRGGSILVLENGRMSKVPYWDYYTGPLCWFFAMGVLLILAWEKYYDPADSKKGLDYFFFSKRLNTCLLIAMVFLGLGMVIGKSFDPIEQMFGSISFFGFAALLIRVLIRWVIYLFRSLRSKFSSS